jgi:hypothetical protein
MRYSEIVENDDDELFATARYVRVAQQVFDWIRHAVEDENIETEEMFENPPMSDWVRDAGQTTDFIEWCYYWLGEEWVDSNLTNLDVPTLERVIRNLQRMIQQELVRISEDDDELFPPSTTGAARRAVAGMRRGGESSGTSRQGLVDATYEQLVAAFGEPIYGPDLDGDKVTCEWVITFSDKKVATIYDWKNDGTPRELYAWHVGGNSPQVVDYVRYALSRV